MVQALNLQGEDVSLSSQKSAFAPVDALAHRHDRAVKRRRSGLIRRAEVGLEQSEMMSQIIRGDGPVTCDLFVSVCDLFFLVLSYLVTISDLILASQVRSPPQDL